MSPAGAARPVTLAVPGARPSGGDLRGRQESLPTVTHARLADPEEDARVAVAPVNEVIAAVARSLAVRAPEAEVALPAHGRLVEIAFLTLGDGGAPEPAIGGLADVVDQLVVAQIAQGVIADPILLIRIEHLDARCGRNRVGVDALLVHLGDVCPGGRH